MKQKIELENKSELKFSLGITAGTHGVSLGDELLWGSKEMDLLRNPRGWEASFHGIS